MLTVCHVTEQAVCLTHVASQLKAPKYFLEISYFLWNRKFKKNKRRGRISVLHCILWMDDTVIYEASPAFAIINSQQWQGTGMCSPQVRQSAHT